MPIPIIIGGIAAVAGIGSAVVSGIKGRSTTNEAKAVQAKATDIINCAKDNINSSKAKVFKSIQELGNSKVDIASDEISDFISVYSRIKSINLTEGKGIDELKHLSMSESEFNDIKNISRSVKSVIGGTTVGIGTGAIVGWSVCGSSAVLNSTLVWLSGGAVATGGGGVVLGATILGGIIAGPALLATGWMYNAHAKSKLENAYSNLAEARLISSEMNRASLELRHLDDVVNQTNNLLRKLNNEFRKSIQDIDKLTSTKSEWKMYTREEKERVGKCVKYAQGVKLILDTPILTNDGNIDTKAKELIKDTSLKQLAGI